MQQGDLPACIDIARGSLDHLDDDHGAIANWFDARITHNPWQHTLGGIGIGAEEHGALVAFRAMFAQPWWIEGRPTVIAFAAHTYIEPAYRGRGLGGQLIAASRSFAPVTGSTTAGNITQKVYRKQGFVAIGGEGNDFFRLRASFVGSMVARLGSGLGRLAGRAADSLAHVCEGRLGTTSGFRLEPVSLCSEEFDELWVRSRPAYASCLERSSRYLNWRLFDFPTYPLAMLALRDTRGRLRGYGIWHHQKYSEHISCAVLRDLFSEMGDDAAQRALLALAIRYWRDLGITWVNLEVASDRLSRLFASLGFEQLSSIGNRYHIHSWQSLGPEVIAGWFRSGLDGDYCDIREPKFSA
jgi:GNAT superfamily N-acetyltransferase